MRQSKRYYHYHSGYYMTCQHLSNGNCLIASQFAGRMVSVTASWCIHCTSAEPPQQLNAVTISLAKTPARTRRSNTTNAIGDTHREQRRIRIEEASRRKKQLIAWLKLLRSLEDAGVGDTAQRLLAQKKKQKLWVATDARDAIGCLLRQCSCSRTDAVKRLNEQYPR